MEYLNFKKIFIQGSFLTLVVFLAFLINCSQNVEGIKRDVAPLPNGARFLVISSANADGSPLTDYDITITANSTDSTFTSSTQSDTISGVTNGIVTIVVSKTGHVGDTKDFEVILPTDLSHDYLATVSFALTESNPPVTIDNSTGGTIAVESTVASAVQTTLDIPAGAIPGGGSTDISVTPVADDPTDLSTDEITGDSFAFQPAGLEFDIPVTVTVPLNLPAGFENVPVTFDYEGTPPESKVMSVNADGTGSSDIDHFSSYVINFSNGIRVILSDGTPLTKTYVSGCGAALNKTFTQTKSVGLQMGFILGRRSAAARQLTKSVDVSKAAISDAKITAVATIPTFNYEVRVISNNLLLDSGTGIPNIIVAGTLVPTNAACHNSGGG